MFCNRQCRDGSECRSREVCDMTEYAVRVVRPAGCEQYNTRAPSSVDALVEAGDRHGWDSRLSVRRVVA